MTILAQPQRTYIVHDIRISSPRKQKRMKQDTRRCKFTWNGDIEIAEGQRIYQFPLLCSPAPSPRSQRWCSCIAWRLEARDTFNSCPQFVSWTIIKVVEQQLFSWNSDGGEDFPVSKLLVLILSFIGKLSKKPWKIKVNKKSLEFKTSSRENISMRIT